MRTSMEALVNKVEQYQWKRFDDLRFISFESESYLRAINEMASHIVEVNSRLVNRASADGHDAELSAARDKNELVPEEQTFYLDSLSAFTDGMPELGAIIQKQTDIQARISSVFQDGTRQALVHREKTRGVKDALIVTARVATVLRPLAEDFEQEAQRFAGKVNELDPHVRRVISFWREHNEDEAVSAALKNMCEQVEATKGAKDAIDRYIVVLRSTANLSRVLYEPTKQIERGASLFSGACALVISWEDSLG